VSQGRAGASGWAWRPVARDPLLARAFHSCTELGGRFYLVGGLIAGGERDPSSDAVVFDPTGGQVVRLGAPGCPPRSHHDAAAVGQRWLCVVGGWDGSRRLATVAALDTEREVWEAWTGTPSNCPPAGLSSHTCTRLSDRELRVAGREGSVRTQRRYGSIYTLKLDPRARTYWYGTPCHKPSNLLSSTLEKQMLSISIQPIHILTLHLTSLRAGLYSITLMGNCPMLAIFDKDCADKALQHNFQKTSLRPQISAYPQLQGRRLPYSLTLRSLCCPPPNSWAPPRSSAIALRGLQLR
jgi:hypothetical protein